MSISFDLNFNIIQTNLFESKLFLSYSTNSNAMSLLIDDTSCKSKIRSHNFMQITKKLLRLLHDLMHVCISYIHFLYAYHIYTSKSDDECIYVMPCSLATWWLILFSLYIKQLINKHCIHALFSSIYVCAQCTWIWKRASCVNFFWIIKRHR